jgi:hypothetical protein
VHTSSSAWAFELQQLEPDIRERLGPAAPKKLRFAPGPLPERSREQVEEARTPPPEPTPDEVDQAARLAAAIDDEELRKLVAKAAAQSLARARSGP